MKKFFKLEENNTNISTEVLAGLTTFFAMAYILFVAPSILGTTGMPTQAIFFGDNYCFRGQYTDYGTFC